MALQEGGEEISPGGGWPFLFQSGMTGRYRLIKSKKFSEDVPIRQIDLTVRYDAQKLVVSLFRTEYIA